MSDQVAVLFANEAFYVAFAARDPEAMSDVWSQRAAVTCVHPGWSPLAGREEVMRSWRAILSNPNMPPIVHRNAIARLFGEVAYVLCHEKLQDAFLVATNVFVREGGRWRMVHHQAGAAPTPELESPPSPIPLQ